MDAINKTEEVLQWRDQRMALLGYIDDADNLREHEKRIRTLKVYILRIEAEIILLDGLSKMKL